MEQTRTIKTRARTGCLTCRRRRRKCDECKPVCRNCKAKEFACQYPALTFITTSHERTEPLDDTRSGYRAIKFVQNPSSRTSSKVRTRQALHEVQHGEMELEINAETDGSPTDIPQEIPVLSMNQAESTSTPTPGEQVALSPGAAGDVQSTTSYGSGLKAPSANISSSCTMDVGSIIASPSCTQQQSPLTATASRLLQSADPPTSNKNLETLLVCHFRYILAPLIDAGDHKGPFGVSAVLLARDHRSIMAAILAASACHRAVLSPSTKSRDLASSHHYRQEAEIRLADEASSIQLIGRVLLSLDLFFQSGPSQWKDYLSNMNTDLDALASQAPAGRCWESLLWFCFRIDLAASIFAEKPPQTPLDVSSQHIVLSDVLYPQSSSWRRLYHSVLQTLHKTLFLVRGSRNTPCSPTITGNTPPMGSRTASDFLSGWVDLWHESQTWYHELPAFMRPVVVVPATEASQLDPDEPASFPAYVYTNTFALLSNMAYHINSLLLLSYKPRILEASATPKQALSQSWHTLSLAGTASSNDFPEQWDPVVVAGLLLVARRLTHKAQQAALLLCLERCTAVAGIMLEHEVDEVRKLWEVSRCYT
ncbi:Fungal Zn2-Cys6 binuclear cluster domain-containing protein [Cladophialophora immunda]|nr:Fungal Zn2-Cys6 binuclear cluster domain-containing protein [Cladophialophora immunda]